MKKPEAQTLVLVLGLGTAITSCTLIIGGDKNYVDLDAASGSSSATTTGTIATTGETASGAGGAAMTASSSSAGGMTGQGGSTGTCGSSQGGCGGAASTTASSAASSSSSSSTGSGGVVPCGPSGPLTDSFTGAMLDVTKWGSYVDALGSTVSQTNDEIAIFNPGVANSYAGVYSQDRFHFQGCSVSLMFPDSPKLVGMTVYFVLSAITGNGDKVAFTQKGDYLHLEARLANALKVLKQIPFDKNKHVYWRLRESSAGGGTVNWETSDTGVTWELQFSYAISSLGFPIEQMLANFGVISEGSPEATVHIDNFNLIP